MQLSMKQVAEELIEKNQLGTKSVNLKEWSFRPSTNKMILCIMTHQNVES